MRTPVKAESVVEKKEPVKIAGGLLVRLPIKKVFCDNCKKLVYGKVLNSGISTLIDCPKCGQRLWSWSVTSWRGAESADSKLPLKIR
jgi:hypothetical protein